MRMSEWSSGVCSSDRCPWDWSSSFSFIAQAREEIAPSLGRHVEQAPQRIDEVAGAVVLAGILGRVGHFARPLMPDGIAVLAEDVRSAERRVGRECVSTFRSRGSPYD